MQWSGKRKWLWAIAAPSSQHSMGHFSVVFVKITSTELQNCMYQTAHGPCLSQSLLMESTCMYFPGKIGHFLENGGIWMINHHIFKVFKFLKYNLLGLHSRNGHELWWRLCQQTGKIHTQKMLGEYHRWKHLTSIMIRKKRHL